jgi:hypothetical protein
VPIWRASLSPWVISFSESLDPDKTFWVRFRRSPNWACVKDVLIVKRATKKLTWRKARIFIIISFTDYSLKYRMA